MSLPPPGPSSVHTTNERWQPSGWNLSRGNDQGARPLPAGTTALTGYGIQGNEDQFPFTSGVTLAFKAPHCLPQPSLFGGICSLRDTYSAASLPGKGLHVSTCLQSICPEILVQHPWLSLESLWPPCRQSLWGVPKGIFWLPYILCQGRPSPSLQVPVFLGCSHFIYLNVGEILHLFISKNWFGLWPGS